MNRTLKVIHAVAALVRAEPALTQAVLVALIGSDNVLRMAGTDQRGIILAAANAVLALAGGAVLRRHVWTAKSVQQAVQNAVVNTARRAVSVTSVPAKPKP